MGRPSNNQRSAGPAGAPESAQVDSVDTTPPEKESAAVIDEADGTVVAGAASDAAPAIDPPAEDDDADTDADAAEDAAEDEVEVVEASVAKGRTVQDVDGTNRRPGQTVRVPAADHGRLVELGFLAKPARSIVVPVKKGPSVTRGS